MVDELSVFELLRFNNMEIGPETTKMTTNNPDESELGPESKSYKIWNGKEFQTSQKPHVWQRSNYSQFKQAP